MFCTAHERDKVSFCLLLCFSSLIFHFTLGQQILTPLFYEAHPFLNFVPSTASQYLIRFAPPHNSILSVCIEFDLSE